MFAEAGMQVRMKNKLDGFFILNLCRKRPKLNDIREIAFAISYHAAAWDAA